MDSMYSAIKGRRGGLMDEPHKMMGMEEEESAPSQGAGVDMKSLVGALSEGQKAQLLKLLVNDSPKGKDESVLPIEQGGQSPGEEADLEQELGEGHESEDEIAESMISHSDKMRSDRGDNPRNLGERMKFNLASKLKKKGK